MHVSHFPELIPVTQFMVVATRNSALVTATPPHITNGVIIGYIVSYEVVGSGDVMMANFTTNNTLLNDEVQSLQPFTNYMFSVRACCDVRCTPHSDNVTQMTLEDGKL